MFNNSIIFEETYFQRREFPRSGSKAKDGGERKKRPKVGNNNGQLLIANATSGGAHEAAWAKIKNITSTFGFRAI